MARWAKSHKCVFLCLVFFALVLGVSCSPAVSWADTVGAPSDVKASSFSSSYIKIKWKAPSSQKVDSYRVYRKKGGKYKLVKIVSADKHSYKDKRLKKGKTYYYRVAAVFSSNKRSKKSDVVFARTGKKSTSRNVASVLVKGGTHINLKAGQKKALGVTLKASGKNKKVLSKKLRYLSSNASVAKVDSKGGITALNEGKCVITIKAHNGKTAKATVVVQASIPVLAYHGVATAEDKVKEYSSDNLTITVAQFEQELKTLHERGYRSLTCEEFYKWYKGEIKLPKKSVLITFDDARSCAIDQIPELLNKYSMKATVFVIGKFSQDPYGKDSWTQVSDATDLLKAKAKCPGIEYQSHTYDLHYRNDSIKDLALSPIAFFKSYADFKLDISKQREFQEEYMPEESFEFLAYPYGADPEAFRQAVKDSDLKMAFDYGHNDWAAKTDNQYSIPRIKIRTDTTKTMFNSWLVA